MNNSEKGVLMHETEEFLSRKEDSNWLYENFVRVVKKFSDFPRVGKGEKESGIKNLVTL